MPNIKGISDSNGNIKITKLDDQSVDFTRINLVRSVEAKYLIGSRWLKSHRVLRDKIVFEDSDQSMKSIMQDFLFPSNTMTITDNPDFDVLIVIYTDETKINKNRTLVGVYNKG